MDKSKCFHFGYVSKTIGYEGELVFFLDVDDPKKYQKLESVFIELNDQLVPFFIKSIKIKNNFANVIIEGVDSSDKATELLRQQLYLPLSFLPKLKANEFYFHEVAGFKVIDNDYGEVGVVENVLDFPQQNILQIKKGDKEILIPIKKEFILKVDRTNSIIEVSTPEGLIDLYLNDNKSEEEN